MSRRAVAKRPASSEELNYWSGLATSIRKLSTSCSASEETIGRVTRLLAAWPADDSLPAEGLDGLKNIYKKLHMGLNDIKGSAERDVITMDEVLEKLDVLIALRKAPEAPPPEKRNKRARGGSPTTAPALVLPTSVPPARAVSITVPPRNSVGPPQVPFSRDPKARREALAKQLPLQEGRKVAFHPPPNTSKAAEGVPGGKDEEWILAVVTKCINQDKNRYEVQDPEPQEDGKPGLCYNTTLRAIIPLPDPGAPPDSATHLNAYPEFVSGMTVMALYPDTSCFYRAQVIASPRDMNTSGRGGHSSKQPPIPMYKLKFEDDDDQEHNVSAQWVVEWPGS